MTFRRFMSRVHLWVGIPVGVIIFIMCLTAAIYALRQEITLLSSPIPTVHPPTPSTPWLGPERLRQAVLQQLPAKTKGEADTMLPISAIDYYDRDEAAKLTVGPRKRAKTFYYANPYTGQLLETRTTESAFFQSMLRGHRWLWLPREIGRPITGAATLLFFLILLSGMVMWWPRRYNGKAIKHAFKLSWRGTVGMLLHRWHAVLGVYVLVFALLFILTALTWSYRWYGDAYYAMWGTPRQEKSAHPTTTTADKGNKRQRGALHGTKQQHETIRRTQTDSLWLTWQAQRPQHKGAVYGYTYNTKPHAPLAFAYNPSYFSRHKQDTYLYDAKTLRPLPAKRSLWQDTPLPAQIARSTYDIHTGGVWGVTGHILAAIIALMLASMPITGVWIWWRRTRGRNKRYAKADVKKLAEETKK